MTEAEWLSANAPSPMLRFLCDRRNAAERPRKLRLFCCAWYRRLWTRFPHQDMDWSFLDVCERYAEGRMAKTLFKLARKRARDRMSTFEAAGSWTSS